MSDNTPARGRANVARTAVTHALGVRAFGRRVTGALVALATALVLGAPGAAHAGGGGPAPGPFGPYSCAAAQWPWSCLAECESSGDWRANTGNDYYGGLQFWQSTWREHGGLDHAPRADLATRAQQIDIAERVLGDQGWSAWPDCSKRYRLDGRVHVVRGGETLVSIARKYQVRGGWQALYRANRYMIGSHPERLNIGTMLAIP